MSLYQYGDAFFAYQQIGSLESARAVAPLVIRHLRANSVLDVGCGAGAWMAAYLELGLSDVVGVDGGYLRPDQLVVDPSRFQPNDVADRFRLGREFDVAQCLEVAEHLDPAASETLVDNLIAHAPMVVFSAAPPGQGGEHHVNERPYEYWRDLFEARGYALLDFLREQVRGRFDVEPWYRYNMLLFVRHDAIDRLDPAIAGTRIRANTRVPEVAPIGWQMRRRVLSLLPTGAVSWLASVKHRMVLRKLAALAERT